LFGEPRVSFLSFGKQTFFGGEKSALAIDIDTASFEDWLGVVMFGFPERAIDIGRDEFGDIIIEIKVVVLGPCIEA
jgi:hypothetical protein